MEKKWENNWKKSPGNEDNHYDGDIQPVEYFASSKPESLSANVEKYVIRHSKKAGKLDLEKARWYVDWLRKSMMLTNRIYAGDFIAANNFDEDTKEIVLLLEEFETGADWDRSLDILDEVDKRIVSMIKRHYE